MILILTPFFSPNVGGVETHLNDLCQSLSKRGLKTNVLTYQPLTVSGKSFGKESSSNLEIQRFWWPGHNIFHKLERYHPVFNFLYLTPGLFLRSFFFMLTRAKEVRVIHSQGLTAGLIGLIFKKIFKKRLIISTHAIYHAGKKTSFSKVAAFVFNSADSILALSQASKRELVKIGVNSGKVDVYTYWVDQKCFKPKDKKESKKKLNLSGKFVVLFVGRLIKIKGARLLLGIAKKKKQITFAFVGIGPEADLVKKAAEKYSNIIFFGRVDNHKLPLYYSAADIFVIPSLYEEGFGRVIAESLSCGTPVIGTNRGGIPEAIGKEVGIIVKADRKSIEAAIDKSFKNRVKLHSLAEKSRQYALEKFSEKNVRIILDSYQLS